jgi:hypothetical protein
MRFMALLFAGLTLACTDAGGNLQGPPPAEAALPANAAILDAAAVPAMLRQCSRTTPAAGEGSWRPGPADIAALEAALPASLATQSRPGVDWSRAPDGWLRQYVGILRGGRRFIYGNFIPSSLGGDDPAGRWQHEAVVICDGGPQFFGVEYDIDARRFTHFAFNGSV